jgi:hypothetical protein
VVVEWADGTEQGNIRNLSAGGAAIEFEPALGKPPVAFDFGDPVQVQPQGAEVLRGSVVRSYDGGLAMRFERDEESLVESIAAIARDTQDRG